MAKRTDLAVELGEENFKESVEKLIEKKIVVKKGVEIIVIKIKTQKAVTFLKKPVGVYITLQKKDMLEPNNILDMEEILTKEILKFLRDKKNILIVGLGNKSITPDSLGPKVADQIVATRHINEKIEKILGSFKVKSVSVVSPGVLGRTGMETTEIVKACLQFVKPDIVVAIDALAAKDFKRLGSTIQLTDSGICPGSGVENEREELSENVLKTPVLAIGVPTVVDGEQLNKEKKTAYTMLTPKNIDYIIDKSAKLIANSINRALFKELERSEFKALYY